MFVCMKKKHELASKKRHPIQVVARRSGLSADVLRAWEKRYRLVEPERSAGGRRLYSDDDVERLRLIREAIAGGRRVGQVARLAAAELEELVEQDRSLAPPEPAGLPTSSDTAVPRTLLPACFEAVLGLDAERLAQLLHRAVVELQPTAFIDEVASPLMGRIGTAWERGELTISHEHLASGVVRAVLLDVVERLRPAAAAPRIVVGTPSGQQHDIGAVLAAAAASLEGWHVIFVGADVPAADIAAAVRGTGARAVALSVTFPGDGVDRHLADVRAQLPQEVPVLVGGQQARRFTARSASSGMVALRDLASLRAVLQALTPNR